MPKKAQKITTSTSRQQAMNDLERDVVHFRQKVADLQQRVTAFLREQHMASEADSLKKARKKIASK